MSDNRESKFLTDALPNRPSVGAVMPADRLQRSAFIGSMLFGVSAVLYLAGYTLAAMGPTWWLQMLGAGMMGFQASVLFVIGHDACHGSLTPNSLLNRTLATLSFLPALHPYTTWKYTHNGLHHGWTNVRGKEVVYVPFAVEDFARLPRWRRLAERFFRSVWGVYAFYFFTVYLPHELFPNRERGPKGSGWRTFQWERGLVIIYAIALIAGAVLLAQEFGRPVWLALACTIGIPTLIYFGLMSAVTFLHHTHPRAPWHDLKDFSYFGIVRSTVHVELPRVIEIVLHEIHLHTAHHADTRIPLYNLAESQRALEKAYGDNVVHEPWSWSGFLRTMRTCGLHDYEKHEWLGFDGKVMSREPARFMRDVPVREQPSTLTNQKI